MRDSYDDSNKFYIIYIIVVWFGIFFHPFSHICNIGHVNYRLQFKKQLIIHRHPHNTI
jgi:hypothetical protein